MLWKNCAENYKKIVFVFFLLKCHEGKPLEPKHHQPFLLFPDYDESALTAIPKCSNNRTFCEDVEIYPEVEFYKVLKNSTYEKEYFKLQDSQKNDSLSHRFYSEKEYYICDSRRRRQYPRAACNIKNEWKFVYNFDKYKQEITTEECISESPCVSFQEAPKDVKTKCVQKYSDRLLLVADKDGKPIWDLFWFPSACICSYEPIINFNHV